MLELVNSGRAGKFTQREYVLNQANNWTVTLEEDFGTQMFLAVGQGEVTRIVMNEENQMAVQSFPLQLLSPRNGCGARFVFPLAKKGTEVRFVVTHPSANIWLLGIDVTGAPLVQL